MGHHDFGCEEQALESHRSGLRLARFLLVSCVILNTLLRFYNPVSQCKVNTMLRHTPHPEGAQSRMKQRHGDKSLRYRESRWRTQG